MRLLLFTKYFLPDHEYMENAFAREFKKYYDVFVLTTTLEPINNNDKFQIGKEEFSGIELKRLDVFKLGRNKNLFFPKKLLKNINAINPNIVFFQSLEHYFTGTAIILIKIVKRYKVYTVVNEHFTYSKNSNNEKENFRAKAKRRLEIMMKYFILQYSDKVVTMNSYCNKKALFYNKNIKNNIVAITLGVDNSIIKYNSIERNKIRDKFKIGCNEILVIHTGKMYPDKKTHLIIEAVNKINNPNVKMMFIGKYDAEYKKAINEIVKKYRLEDKTIFLEFVDSKNLNFYYSAADIAVWPDMFTISTIEASAVGLPIIIPDYEGYEHRIKNNNGFSIKPGDLCDLILKLELLINDKELRKEMGKKGVELIQNELNWKCIVGKILNSKTNTE